MLSDTANVAVTVEPSTPAAYVFDDFSTYTTGSFPSGWTLMGSAQIAPIVLEVGGTGAAYHMFDFPEVGWQYWDSIAVRNGVVASTAYTVEVKLRFLNDVADRAGLSIALDRSTLARIDIQPNVYTNQIEFRSSFGGRSTEYVPTCPSRAA